MGATATIHATVIASDMSDPMEMSISPIRITNVTPTAAIAVAEACNRTLLRLLIVKNGFETLANTIITSNSITTIEYC